MCSVCGGLRGGIVSRYCPDCQAGIAYCAICKQMGIVGHHILKCKMGSCGFYFHNICLNPLRDSGLLKIHRCAKLLLHTQ